MAKYTLTSRADTDLSEIVDHIALDNIDAAIAIDARFTELFEMLAQNPLAGRERPELESGIRSFPAGNFHIFYRTWADDVLIVRVRHAARDLDEIFS